MSTRSVYDATSYQIGHSYLVDEVNGNDKLALTAYVKWQIRVVEKMSDKISLFVYFQWQIYSFNQNAIVWQQ